MKRLLDCVLYLAVVVGMLMPQVILSPGITYAADDCSISAEPNNGFLVVTLTGEDADKANAHVILEKRDGNGDPVGDSIFTTNIRERPEQNEVVFTFSPGDLPQGGDADQYRIYGHIGGFILCGPNPTEGLSVPDIPEPPDDTPDNPNEPGEPPVDPVIDEAYEKARIATENARDNAACVANNSNTAMERLGLADPDAAKVAFDKAEACDNALDENLATIKNVELFLNGKDIPESRSHYEPDLDRWLGEVEGLDTSVEPVFDEAEHLMDACGDVGHTIVCSRDPDSYDEEEADEAAENSNIGGTIDNNPCFNDRIDEFIYNSTECQNQREQQAELSDKDRAIAECEDRKSEGAVWVVFANQCTTFVEFGGVAISYTLTLASIIAGVMFVAASFKYLGSKGDPAALADARDMMINAAVGMVLVASAFAIVQLLNGSFGFADGAINLLPFFEFNPI